MMKKLILSLALTAGIGSALSGAVVLHDENSETTAQVANPSITDLSVSASTTSNSIVGVFIGMQDYNSASYSATLNDVAMTQAIADFAASDQRGTFFWLETQAVGSNLIDITTSNADAGNQRGMIAYAFVLNNVDTSVNPVTQTATLDADLADTTMDLTLTPPSSGAGVLGFGIRDSSPSNVSVTSSYFSSLDGDVGNGGYFASKMDVPGTSQAVDFDVTDSRDSLSDNSAAMAVAFAVIPEPSAGVLLLSAFGLLGLLRRRR